MLFLVGAAAGVGAGGYASVSGELKETDAVIFVSAYDAALAAPLDLQCRGIQTK